MKYYAVVDLKTSIPLGFYRVLDNLRVEQYIIGLNWVEYSNDKFFVRLELNTPGNIKLTTENEANTYIKKWEEAAKIEGLD